MENGGKTSGAEIHLQRREKRKTSFWRDAKGRFMWKDTVKIEEMRLNAEFSHGKRRDA